MGWSGGSRVMSGIIGAIQPRVKNKSLRVELYREIIEVLEAGDWDTQDECLGEDPAYDEVYNELYPPDDEDDDEDDFDEEDDLDDDPDDEEDE